VAPYKLHGLRRGDVTVVTHDDLHPTQSGTPTFPRMDARQIVLAPEGGETKPTGVVVGVLRAGFRVLSAMSPAMAARAAERIWFAPPHLRIRSDSRAFLATGERRVISLDGRPVVFWSWGTGPTVILVHGWGGLGAQMEPFVARLAGSGYRAITFDAPGHGESVPSRLGGRRSTLFEFADALNAIANEADVAGIIAHSGGCTAAAGALALRPASWAPSRMVFIAPMASPKRYKKIFQRAIGLSEEGLRRFSENTERMLSFRWDDLEVPAMAQRFQPPPTLVIHDRDDRDTDWSEGASIAEAWPDADLHTTTGLGHRRILRDPAIVERAVDFVTVSPGRTSR
jgi:pimeloyl-ACP methyl ester carboxylesterase